METEGPAPSDGEVGEHPDQVPSENRIGRRTDMEKTKNVRKRGLTPFPPQKGLEMLGKTEAELFSARKGSLWKVALARYLRETSLVPNAWLATHLHTGTAKSVSSRISYHRNTVSSDEATWKILKMLECVD